MPVEGCSHFRLYSPFWIRPAPRPSILIRPPKSEPFAARQPPMQCDEGFRASVEGPKTLSAAVSDLQVKMGFCQESGSTEELFRAVLSSVSWH